MKGSANTPAARDLFSLNPESKKLTEATAHILDPAPCKRIPKFTLSPQLQLMTYLIRLRQEDQLLMMMLLPERTV